MLFPFGCLMVILRPIFTLIFGIVLFLGCLGFVLVTSVRDNFLTSEFYLDNLAENDVYERIYTEVLLDQEFEDTTQELMGDIQVPQADIVGLAKEIIPPDYLQAQVEGAVTGTIDYLNKDTDDPQVFIDLGPPLDRVKPTLLGYIDRRIDALAEEPVKSIEDLGQKLEVLYDLLKDGKIQEINTIPVIEDTAALVDNYVDETLAQLQEIPVNTEEEFQEAVENIYEDLASGTFPTEIPSVGAISISLRISSYDLALEAARRDGTVPLETLAALDRQEAVIKNQLRIGDVKAALKVASPELTAPVLSEFVDDAYEKAFATLSNDPNFPQRALAGLDERSEDIKTALGEGKIKDALKAGVSGLASPLIDDAIDELKKDLDGQSRLDLIEKAAEQNDESKEEFLDQVDIVRNVIDRSQVGEWLAIAVIVAAGLAMSFVQIPRMASALRMPGITLFFSGVLFLALGLITGSQLLKEPVNREGVDAIPPSLVDIINDLSTSMASDVGAGFINFSIILIVVGFGLALGSFFIRMLHIPFLSK